MKLEVKLLFTVSHVAKEVYWCISQYSTTQYIISNVKHSLKWRNIKHTISPHKNKMQNAKTARIVVIT